MPCSPLPHPVALGDLGIKCRTGSVFPIREGWTAPVLPEWSLGVVDELGVIKCSSLFAVFWSGPSSPGSWDPCWKWMILDSSFLVGLSSLQLMSGLSIPGPLGPTLGADSPGILIVFWNSRVVTIFAGEPFPKFSRWVSHPRVASPSSLDLLFVLNRSHNVPWVSG